MIIIVTSSKCVAQLGAYASAHRCNGGTGGSRVTTMLSTFIFNPMRKPQHHRHRRRRRRRCFCGRPARVSGVYHITRGVHVCGIWVDGYSVFAKRNASVGQRDCLCSNVRHITPSRLVSAHAREPPALKFTRCGCWFKICNQVYNNSMRFYTFFQNIQRDICWNFRKKNKAPVPILGSDPPAWVNFQVECTWHDHVNVMSCGFHLQNCSHHELVD